ncbi:hypothetical protein NQ314_006465 [Rhamnusium bicolor]|uniref:Aminopeptidase N-like N-terminal domain-containing protein n=1 Tax=Rhamnusium bicolor TaxID=1586634 RepID=A0AAV8Z239_9CUCU|nr:hypothetical protein NQ314_006465 [Rhamnusium bicolor]
MSNVPDATESTVITPKSVAIESAKKVRKKPLFNITFQSPIRPGAVLEIFIQFTGRLFNDTSEGLFRSSYIDPVIKETKWFVSTHMRPNLARSVFPCFDEPAYKVPMVITVGRHKNMSVISNMPLKSTTPM